jgi:hypothetical protein
VQAIGTLLVGIAAIAALVFTWQSVNATNRQLQATEQGQITDRYNAAITNLGSPSVDVRLGGIYSLQRIMQDSPRDQPTIVAVLCAFVRDHARAAAVKTVHSPTASSPTDIEAALTVVGTRNTAHDGSATVVDFTGADLSNLDLSRATLPSVNLSGADLTFTDLSHAELFYAILSGAALSHTNLSHADLWHADLTGVLVDKPNFSNADLTCAKLSHADFSGDIDPAIGFPTVIPVCPIPSPSPRP